MIVYVDASALVKRYVEEQGSTAVERLLLEPVMLGPRSSPVPKYPPRSDEQRERARGLGRRPRRPCAFPLRLAEPGADPPMKPQ